MEIVASPEKLGIIKEIDIASWSAGRPGKPGDIRYRLDLAGGAVMVPAGLLPDLVAAPVGRRPRRVTGRHPAKASAIPSASTDAMDARFSLSPEGGTAGGALLHVLLVRPPPPARGGRQRRDAEGLQPVRARSSATGFGWRRASSTQGPFSRRATYDYQLEAFAAAGRGRRPVLRHILLLLLTAAASAPWS